MIPYGRQFVDEEDIKAVVEVLRSEWLTTGPKILEFEKVFAQFVGAKHAVAVSSGTAALHAAMYAIGIRPGDEVIVPAITFAATANCVVFQGGTPIFADVDPDTLLLDPNKAEAKITAHTKAIISVDYAGQPCEYDILREVAENHGLALVADACHALGATYSGRPVGSLADLNTFSFHPVKHMTTGEGGMVTTDDEDLAQRMRTFRNHGITTDHRQREEQSSWFYEMVDLGYNYRITDFQCALGISQLKKLPKWILRRQEIANRYCRAFSSCASLMPLAVQAGVSHAYHLFIVRLDEEKIGKSRNQVFQELRKTGVGANVHYTPVHLHPFYTNKFATGPGLCPVAESVFERIISLPIFAAMTDQELDFVIQSLNRILFSKK